MKTVMAIMAICFGSLLYGSTALADLGTCYIYRDGSSELKGEEFEKLSKKILNAYSQSDDSDGDFVFLLDTFSGSKPEGSYTIIKLDMKFRGPYPMNGYRITATDLAGLKNGAAEIVKAFKEGRIYNLKRGKRKGLVDKPIYE